MCGDGKREPVFSDIDGLFEDLFEAHRAPAVEQNVPCVDSFGGSIPKEGRRWSESCRRCCCYTRRRGYFSISAESLKMDPVLMSLLAFELVVTRYVTLKNVGGDAMVVPDELEAQSGTGKAGLRLR